MVRELGEKTEVTQKRFISLDESKKQLQKQGKELHNMHMHVYREIFKNQYY